MCLPVLFGRDIALRCPRRVQRRNANPWRSNGGKIAPAERGRDAAARRPYLAILLSLTLAFGVRAAMPTPDADNGGITLPPGFRALVVADNLMANRRGDNLRFLAVAPNGDVYAKTSRGGILALRDTDGDGRLDQKQEFGGGGGTGIAIRDGWLYHSSNTGVYRYHYQPGQLVPEGEQET